MIPYVLNLQHNITMYAHVLLFFFVVVFFFVFVFVVVNIDYNLDKLY